MTLWRGWKSGKEQKVRPSSQPSFGCCSLLIDYRWIARQRGADVSPLIYEGEQCFFRIGQSFSELFLCPCKEKKSWRHILASCRSTGFCDSFLSLNKDLFDLSFQRKKGFYYANSKIRMMYCTSLQLALLSIMLTNALFLHLSSFLAVIPAVWTRQRF